MKYTNKRRSNLGTLHIDRYNLQGLYNARRRTLLEPLQPLSRSIEPTEDVPELDESVFLTPFCETKTLNQTINQLFAMEKPLYPNRTKLTGKRVIRCSDCERPLYKPEYSPTSIKSKIQLVPENGDEDQTLVSCETPSIEFTLLNKDDTADIGGRAVTPTEEPPGCSFVFKSRHRVGIRLSVHAKPGNAENFLCLQLNYLNKGVATEIEKQNEWISTRVRLSLGSTVA
uniref:Dynactin subunit 4 n=1 Tax=Steinernema glaseri TaxID=37863 RepID=A0A1I8ARN1_9BILA